MTVQESEAGKVLMEEWQPPYIARVEYFTDPVGMTDFAGLRQADHEAQAMTEDSIRRALVAAFSVSGGAKHDQ